MLKLVADMDSLVGESDERLEKSRLKLTKTITQIGEESEKRLLEADDACKRQQSTVEIAKKEIEALVGELAESFKEAEKEVLARVKEEKVHFASFEEGDRQIKEEYALFEESLKYLKDFPYSHLKPSSLDVKEDRFRIVFEDGSKGTFLRMAGEKADDGDSYYDIDSVLPSLDELVKEAFDEEKISEILYHGHSLIAMLGDLPRAYSSSYGREALNDYCDRAAENATIIVKTEGEKEIAEIEADKESRSRKLVADYATWRKEMEAIPEPTFEDKPLIAFPTLIKLGNLYALESWKENVNRWLKALPDDKILTGEFAGNRSTEPLPLVWDLEEKRNIIVDVDKYDQRIIDFIYQIIISFVLSFPSSSLRLQLVDPLDHLSFSSFTSLSKINERIFLDGIVRDIDGVKKAIKSVGDLKLRADDALNLDSKYADVFQYNAEMEANPLDICLLVLVDFRKWGDSGLVSEVEKIALSNEKISGVFTLFCDQKINISNSDFVHSDEAAIEELYRVLKGGKSSGEVPAEYFHDEGGKGLAYFINYPRLFGKTDWRFESLSGTVNLRYLSSMREKIASKTKSEASKPIPLSTMFDYIDERGKRDAASQFEIPFGLSGTEIASLSLSDLPHVGIIGSTGSGKSVLFHTLILDACYAYSPEALNIYLLDFKNGTEFAYYKTHSLPHIKLIGITDDVYDGYNVLLNVIEEMNRRSAIFKKEGCENLQQYFEKGNKEHLARLLIIIDEVQELFADQGLAENAMDALSRILRLGRAFGINIIWGSQGVPMAVGFRSQALAHIATRICLRVESRDDASNFFSSDVNLKRIDTLKGKGRGYGLLAVNQKPLEEFRTAYWEDGEVREGYIRRIIEKWPSDSAPAYVIGEEKKANQKTCPLFDGSYIPQSGEEDKEAFAFGDDYVQGGPYIYKMDDYAARENLLILGKDADLIRDILAYNLLSILASGKEDTRIYFVNKESGLRFRNSLFFALNTYFPSSLINASKDEDFLNLISGLYGLYLERKEAIEEGKMIDDLFPCFVFLSNMQNIDTLLDENPRLEVAGSSSSIRLEDAFKTLLLKAGDYGVHFLVSINGNDLSSLSRIRKELLQANHKIATFGSDEGALGDYKLSGIDDVSRVLYLSLSQRRSVVPYRFAMEDSEARSWLEEVAKKGKKEE